MTRTWQVFSLYLQRYLKRRGHLYYIIFSLAILIADILQPSLFQQIGTTINRGFAPINYVTVNSARSIQNIDDISRKFFNQAQQIDRLEQENAQLRQWWHKAKALEIENYQLQRYFNTNIAIANSNIHHIKVQPSLSEKFTLDFTANNNNDWPEWAGVINGTSLIGRLITPEKGEQKLILLSHPESRIPVQIGLFGIQAMLLGQGKKIAKIDYHQSHATEQIKINDRVFSSGFLQYLPSGLAVGTVSKITDQNIEVTLNFDPELLQYAGVVVHNPTTNFDPLYEDQT